MAGYQGPHKGLCERPKRVATADAGDDVMVCRLWTGLGPLLVPAVPAVWLYDVAA